MRICSNCGSDKTSIWKRANWKPVEQWHRYKDGFLCNKCYSRLILSPKWNKINNAKRKRKSIWADNKLKFLPFEPRKGKCEECGLVIGDMFTKVRGGTATVNRTFLHRGDNPFDPKNPLKGTIELCVRCHMKKSWEEGKL